RRGLRPELWHASSSFFDNRAGPELYSLSLHDALPICEADRGVRRRTFGAPFGLERPDHRALALVAIRNVQWHADSVRIGSGAGLLPESRLQREFDELRDKREQVKSLFGIGDVGRALSPAGPAESRSHVR